VRTSCSTCQAPAEYALQDEPLCPDFASRLEAQREGEAFVAIQTLALAVHQLAALGLSDDEMHAALGRTLMEPESEMTVPVTYLAPGFGAAAIPLMEMA